MTPKVTHILKALVLPFLLLSTIFVSIYAAAHSILRSNANDPQIAIAVDYRNSLQSGTPVSKLPTLSKIDPSQSVSPFVIIYDGAQKPVASSLPQNIGILKIPNGVLDNVNKEKVVFFTWETGAVRLATVIYKVEGNFNGYVLVARNLAVDEERIQTMSVIVGVSYLTSLAILVLYRILKSKKLEVTEKEVKTDKKRKEEIKLEVEKEEK